MRLPAICLLLMMSFPSIPVFASEVVPPVVNGRTYTQQLIEAAKARHPGILSIVVVGKRYESEDLVVLGSTLDRASVFTKASSPVAEGGGSMGQDGASYLVRQPYVSSTGHFIGMMTIAFAYHDGQDVKPLHAAATSIAGRMARATLSDKNAIDPYPYDPEYGPYTYAQVLTERTTARYPELLVLMMHVNVPGEDKNVVIGSNIARFGKLADEDDMRVIETGEINLEVSSDGERFETELPFLDVNGNIIGALGAVFNYRDGDDKEALRARGIAIRDELASQIKDNAALFEAAP